MISAEEMMYSSEWDTMEMIMDDNTNDFVLESWLTEQDPSSNGSILYGENDVEDMLMIDTDDFDTNAEEIPPTPPAGRLLLEEALADTLAAAAHHGEGGRLVDDDEVSLYSHNNNNNNSEVVSPILSSNANLTSFLPLEQRYQATLEKLTESMKRSQETRKSLRMQTTETAEYNRWDSISGTLSSIEKSTQQLQDYLTSKKPTQAP